MDHPKARTVRNRGELRSAIVVNPSKIDDAPGHRRVVDRALADAGWPAPVWFETTRSDPGFGQARHAVDNGADVVFACGGDGTVTACAGALVGTDAALAVLPAGTGNLLAANLDLPDDPAAGVAVATQMGRRRIDVGEVEGRCFVVMAGMGFDAALVGEASEGLKARIGVGAYVWSALQRLGDRSMHVAVRLDDRAPIRRRARSVLVANVGRLQGGVRLLAQAEPDDGRLDVAIISPRSLRHWLQLTWAVVRGRERIPRMHVARASRVEIVSTRPQARQLDGDAIDPSRRLEVTIRPAALELCVPQPEHNLDLADDAPG